VVDENELAMCKRRGHDAGLGAKVAWAQRKWCGTWIREVHRIEECEDPPLGDKRSSLPYA
jgi:hypothetical protein